MKQKFNIIESTCVPLKVENVDTDQIIPARFLKATTKDEKYFGDMLFRDWRFDAEDKPKPDFVLPFLPRECIRFWWQARTSATAPAVNTLPGP